MNSLELKDKIHTLVEECRAMVDTCKAEVRTMTDEENEKFEGLKKEIEEKKAELKKLEEELASYDEKLPEEPKKEDEENRNNTNISLHKMEKNFSLLRAIRSVVNNSQMDAVDAAVVNAGQGEFRHANVEFAGQIQLPIENRAAITVAAEGEDVVATDILNILEPLRAKNVLAQAGAKFMTGLVGDVQVPVMSASNVTWEGETDAAKDGAGTFGNVKLSPKRLTAYIDISKQFLVQDGLGAEALIRQDLINAINSKLEATILGDAAGTATKPAGLFVLGTGETYTTLSSFADVCNLEAAVEGANVFGDCKYILAPTAKAAFRNMAKSAKSTQLVMEGGEIDGTPTLTTSNVGVTKGVAYGDFSNLAIGSWGAIDLTVDPYTQAGNGKVRLVINAFFDAKVLRPEAIKVAKTA